MPTFVMLSNATSERADGKAFPSHYELAWVEALIGSGGPGCDYDKDDTFNGQLWYAFTEILEGDYSEIRKIDLVPENWYSPEAIIGINCEVLVDSYLKEQEPEWWARMVAARGEPKKAYWSGDMIFGEPIEPQGEVGSPGIYPILSDQIAIIEGEARELVAGKLKSEVLCVADVEVDEDGLAWAKLHGRDLVQLHYQSEGELDHETYEAGYRMTDHVDAKGNVMFIEVQ